MSKLLLLDGNSLTYRAFFALPADMATASGQVTNAVFGFTSMFILVLKEQKPDRCWWPSTAPSRRSATRPTRPTRPTARRRPTCCASRWGSCARCSSALGVAVIELRRLRGRRPHRHRRRAGRRARRRRRDRHRRPRRLPARRRPARQGALQPPRRQRLRALRRSRHLRQDRRHAGAVSRVRRPARRSERQPARRARGRREDRRQADLDLRRARRRSSPTSTSRRRSSGRRSPSTSSGCARTTTSSCCAATRRSTSTSASWRCEPDPAEVKRLFDFLEFRTLRGAPRRSPRPGARASCRRPRSASRSWRRSSIEHRRRRDGGGARRPRRGVPRRGVRGRAGRGRRSRASPSSPTRRTAAVAVDPRAITSRTRPSPPGCPDSGSARHDAKPLMRSLLDRGIELTGLELDTAIAAYLLEAGRGALRAGAPARGLHAVRGAGRRSRQRRAARPRRHEGGATIERAGRERARGRGPLAEPIVAGAGTHRDARSLPRPSRTRWWSCWRGWSTSASPSTAGAAGAQRPPLR